MNQLQAVNGFTLVELLITLAISAILLSVAAPSFDSVVKNNRVRSHARDLGSMLNFSRSEAIARGRVVAICGSSNASSCSASNNWSSGWMVFVDDGSGGATASDNERGGTEEILAVYEYDGTNILTVLDSGGNGVNAVSFRARGSIREDVSITLRICEQDQDVYYARAIVLERTGRAVRSFDLHNAGGSLVADGIYEDVNGDNLTCT